MLIVHHRFLIRFFDDGALIEYLFYLHDPKLLTPPVGQKSFRSGGKVKDSIDHQWSDYYDHYRNQ